jgi:hypothetical protein
MGFRRAYEFSTHSSGTSVARPSNTTPNAKFLVSALTRHRPRGWRRHVQIDGAVIGSRSIWGRHCPRKPKVRPRRRRNCPGPSRGESAPPGARASGVAAARRHRHPPTSWRRSDRSAGSHSAVPSPEFGRVARRIPRSPPQRGNGGIITRHRPYAPASHPDHARRLPCDWVR